jgi:hypothetical protein
MPGRKHIVQGKHMSGNLADLESRVYALEHLNAIKDVQYRYWHCVDAQQLDDVKDCFIDNGAVIDMEGVAPCNSREDFIAVLKAQGGNPGFLSLHSGHNPQIKITGAVHAEGTWDALFVAVDVANRLTYRLTGRYENRYVKRNDQWKIQVQKFRQTSLLIKKIEEDGSEKVITFGKPDPKVFDK